jgi:hypothetical protein
MSAGFEPPTIDGARGILVHMGLATPTSRALVVGSAVGILAYALRMPAVAFDEEGNMRPFKPLSKAPTATNAHFLAVPVGAAALAFLFT